MPRLIDADALRERMYHDAFETDSDMQKWDSGCWIRYKMFENALEEVPTVEAEPVRHGHWIEKDDECECPFCGKAWNYIDNCTETFNYCPNCGAKMQE